MTLCLLTPDAPTLTPDTPTLLPDGWVCGTSPGIEPLQSNPSANTLGVAAPGGSLDATGAASTLTSRLAD